MPDYPVHTMQSAPEDSKPGLEQLKKAFGVIPNLVGAIANSPKLLNALVGIFQQVHTSSLTEAEIQIVLLTDAVANSSSYAVAFHTTLALQQGISAEDLEANRNRVAPQERRPSSIPFPAMALWASSHRQWRDDGRREANKF